MFFLLQYVLFAALITQSMPAYESTRCAYECGALPNVSSNEGLIFLECDRSAGPIGPKVTQVYWPTRADGPAGPANSFNHLRRRTSARAIDQRMAVRTVELFQHAVGTCISRILVRSFVNPSLGGLRSSQSKRLRD